MASGMRLAFSVIRPVNLACVRFQSTAAQTKVYETKPKSAEKGKCFPLTEMGNSHSLTLGADVFQLHLTGVIP
jgi:hypothetical protein